MAQQLRDSVVVITGASSGIGRATARAFARKGAAVVLAARRAGLLRELAAECEGLGGRALAVPTDVTDPAAVADLARAAVARFGRIDVWVNNAAVHLFGRLEDHPAAATRRLIETNVLGYTYGAQAAIGHFRARGKGVLINVASAVAEVPQPYAAAYVMSKHAVRALSRTLRQELWLDGMRDIQVCPVMPATVDTPLFRHGANYSGRAVKAMPPVYTPEGIADAIVRLATRPKAELVPGAATRSVAGLHRLIPGLVERAMARQVDQLHIVRGEPGPTDFEGNLFEPMAAGAEARDGWKARQRRPLLPMAAALALPVALLWGWLRGRRTPRPTLADGAARRQGAGSPL